MMDVLCPKIWLESLLLQLENQQPTDECSLLREVHWGIFALVLFEGRSICNQYKL